MALRDDLRTLLRDDGSPQRYLNASLDTFGRLALVDVNKWGETTYAYADIENANLVPEYIRLLVLYWAQILALRSELDAEGLAKVQSQDSLIDPGNTATGMQRQIAALEKQFDLRVKKWIGVDWGAMIYKTPEEFVEL